MSTSAQLADVSSRLQRIETLLDTPAHLAYFAELHALGLRLAKTTRQQIDFDGLADEVAARVLSELQARLLALAPAVAMAFDVQVPEALSGLLRSGEV